MTKSFLFKMFFWWMLLLSFVSCQSPTKQAEGASASNTEEESNGTREIELVDLKNIADLDLSDWEKVETKAEVGGDAEQEITVYKKGDYFLKVANTSVGEYGYHVSHDLMDAQKKKLQTRLLSFVVDAPDMYLEETVKNLNGVQAEVWYRKQKMEQHFMQMDAKPMHVKGEWEKRSDTDSESIE